MAEGELSQKDLAEALGVPLDRVKSLSAGRVKKLTPDETRALVEKLHVRAHFLATGEAPVFQTPQERSLDTRMQSLKQSTDAAIDLGLPQREGELVRDILFGTAIKSPALVRETIENYVAARQSGPRGRSK